MFSLCASFSAFVRSLLTNQTRKGYKVYYLVDDDIDVWLREKGGFLRERWVFTEKTAARQSGLRVVEICR